jgi:hypothetical protein
MYPCKTKGNISGNGNFYIGIRFCCYTWPALIYYVTQDGVDTIIFLLYKKSTSNNHV